WAACPAWAGWAGWTSSPRRSGRGTGGLAGGLPGVALAERAVAVGHDGRALPDQVGLHAGAACHARHRVRNLLVAAPHRERGVLDHERGVTRGDAHDEAV